MNIYNTLAALYTFLEREFNKTEYPGNGFSALVEGLDPYLWTDGKTADPSLYNKFISLADGFTESEDFSVEKSYKLAEKFLGHLSEESDISDAVRSFSECSLWNWEQICGEITANETTKKRCACCGCYTLEEGGGSFEICPVCFWEDDKSQNRDPESEGGANKICLREAKKNYAVFGACTESAVPFVRVPTAEELSGIVHEPTDSDFV